MNYKKIFSPDAYKEKFLRFLSAKLAPYLATTHLVWGDKANLVLGQNVQLNNVLINCRSGKVIIRDNAFFGHSVMLLTGKHDFSKRGQERHAEVQKVGRDITIGEGAWIASNSVVIGPCVIGDNAVVGAGSIVVDNVPANTLYAGNPASFIKAI